MRLRPALGRDEEGIRELLESVGLDAGDVGKVDGRFVVAAAPDAGLCGCVALDGEGRELLLRSLAVRPEFGGRGLGRLLVDAALLDAWARRARRVVLVTEDADQYFNRLGFESIDPREVGPGIASHPQFNGACPDSAVVMAMELTTLG